MAFMDTLQNIGTGAKDFLIGSPAKQTQLSRFNPEQQQLQSLIGNQAGSLLQNLGKNQFDFAPIAQQARTNFQTKTIPSIANRFAALGAQGSGAYTHALGSAGAGLEEGLASLQSQFGLHQAGQQQSLLLSLLSQALQSQNESLYSPETSGFLQQILPFLIKAGVGYATGGASLPF